jgi:hypothetical protein
VSQLPDLDHLSHAEKDALIRALWAQVQSLTAALFRPVAGRTGTLIEKPMNRKFGRPAALSDTQREETLQRLADGASPLDSKALRNKCLLRGGRPQPEPRHGKLAVHSADARI